jgi:hypothetical protein
LNYESGKQVAADDWPRWTVISTYWFEIALLYFDLFLPYYQEPKLKKLDSIGKSAFERSLLILKFWKDGASQVSNYVRNVFLVGFHIVGMLSSSWQGGVREGDGARPEHIWYE